MGGETRFSGDDSSVKLWRGGDVSELSPDLEPTETKIKVFLQKLFGSFTINRNFI
jgi:hypothetical protein